MLFSYKKQKNNNYILKHPYIVYFNFKDRKIGKLSVPVLRPTIIGLCRSRSRSRSQDQVRLFSVPMYDYMLVPLTFYQIKYILSTVKKATYGEVCTTCDDTQLLTCDAGNYCICITNYFWNGTYCGNLINFIFSLKIS